jgi:hypothetical protein
MNGRDAKSMDRQTAALGGSARTASANRDRAETSCAVRVNGTAVCWGDNHQGQTKVPTGRYAQISAGSALVRAANERHGDLLGKRP